MSDVKYVTIRVPPVLRKRVGLFAKKYSRSINNSFVILCALGCDKLGLPANPSDRLISDIKSDHKIVDEVNQIMKEIPEGGNKNG